MIVKFTFHIIILIIIISPIFSQESNHRDVIIAIPGCNSACGLISIPFPFGMNHSNCYADKWFEIECRNSSSHDQTPYLKSLNLEVKYISYQQSYIEIMNPIHHFNCQNKNNNDKEVINLKGSPFVYSHKNKFLAAGCNTIAFLQSNGTTIGCCVSIFGDTEEDIDKFDFQNGGCRGRYCCETSLPMHLAEYNTTLQNLGEQNGITSSDHGECGIALIASEYYWLPLQSSIENMFDLDYAPAMLEWEILHNSIPIINSTTNLECYESNVTSSTNKSSGHRCYCSNGHDGNPYIVGGCTAIPGSFNKYNDLVKKWAIEGVSSSLISIAFLVGLWSLYKFLRKRMIKKRQENHFKRNGGLLLQQRMSSGEVNVDKAILFSLKDLKKATENFNMNRVLGKGGQGTVYKGMLVDGQIVAVKKFKVEGKVEEFINEFVILSQINNRNVVRLLGCCLETEIPLLVYEFISNGNLFEYLHEQNEDLLVTWDMRLRIATEIAGALFYLHSIACQPIYHRDVKSTNILLDEKYRAKLADFGASRIISIEATHLTTVVQGTFGYLDPEYFHTSQFTEKSDVYSFGVVLVELLTSKKPISPSISGEYQNLAANFVRCMEDNILFEIIDRIVTKEGEEEHIIAVAKLANRCLELNGRKRPTMKEVTLELERIQVLNRKSNAQEVHEEIEFVGKEKHQLSVGYSSLNSLPIMSNGTLSSQEVMHVLSLK